MTILQNAIAQAAAAASGYQIARSLRFNSADSAYLTRTPTSTGNRQTFTWSGWVKIGKNPYSTGGYLFSSRQSGTDNFGININTSMQLVVDGAIGGTAINLITTPVYRDSSAWYHILLAVDTTQATSTNRVKLYVNGTQVTAFGTATYPTQSNTSVNLNTAIHNVSGYNNSSNYFDGYMADVNFVDGQALTPSSFGANDPNTGVWSPVPYSGTYGTNGFWLKFDDNSGVTATTLGKDSSGNGNNWTPNNFSVTAGAGNDSLVDSPTNYGTDTGAGGEVRGNYATLNPLSYNGTSPVLSNGNLDFKASSAAYSLCVASMGIPSSGKWYWEVAVSTITTAGNNQDIAVGKYPFVTTDNMTLVCKLGVTFSTLKYYYATPSVSASDNNAGLATPAQGDIMQIAYDAATGKLWMGVNNTWISSGNPATGANPLYTYSDPTGVFPFQVMYNTTGVSSTNFGQRPFAYTAPSGFKALNTQNLPTPAVGASSTTLASKQFDVTTYTGTNATKNITGIGFRPDFLWFKSRSNAANHALVDVLRGVTKQLQSSTTNAESTNTAGKGVQSFNSDGFTLGQESDAVGGTNDVSQNYVTWMWKANGAGVSNTAGSITSTVSANATAGISVVTYTGNGSASATVGHGLGVAPKMIIVKSRSNAYGWNVYHSSLGAGAYINLNATTGSQSSTTPWANTSPASTVFTIGTTGTGWNNENNVTYVAYCFAEIAGFSKFGSYTGNGSTDGPFVFTGFRPRFVFVKRTDTTGDWVIHDTARSPYNQANAVLYPNLSNAEDTSFNQIDILSNGFKCRSTNTNTNASGGTYVFMAFAEAPLNFARAR
jgi:hypothetical protein